MTPSRYEIIGYWVTRSGRYLGLYSLATQRVFMNSRIVPVKCETIEDLLEVLFYLDGKPGESFKKFCGEFSFTPLTVDLEDYSEDMPF